MFLYSINPNRLYARLMSSKAILAGLNPSIIHDIAGRALSFWVYQATQECVLLGMMHQQVQSFIESCARPKLPFEINSKFMSGRVQGFRIGSALQSHSGSRGTRSSWYEMNLFL
jgi:hypothetical protein